MVWGTRLIENMAIRFRMDLIAESDSVLFPSRKRIIQRRRSCHDPHKPLPLSPDSFCFIIHYENRKMILFTALLFAKIRAQFNPE
jgi:hypothetical protein